VPPRPLALPPVPVLAPPSPVVGSKGMLSAQPAPPIATSAATAKAVKCVRDRGDETGARLMVSMSPGPTDPVRRGALRLNQFREARYRR